MPQPGNYNGPVDAAHDRRVQAGAMPATGVLLVNLGTPEAPTPRALRPYLREFLGDRRVIDYPRWRWWPILQVILLLRPRRSAHAYARIWSAAGSPLRVFSDALAEALRVELGDQAQVALAMRYGAPSVLAQVTALQAAGVRRLLVLPLYPQYSATSTGGVIDAVADTLKALRWPPELRLIGDYHDDPAHIDALARRIEHWWAEHGRGDKLLLSFHGIPERYVRLGDPYAEQCRTTARLLRERLRLQPEQMELSFQSRVGREQWLTPYTDATVRRLAGEGVRRLDVACPGFAVDCLETLEEIAMQNRDFFLAAGGQELRYIPALNDSPEQVASLAALLRRHLQGWR
jgi:protoporphyrin/coproporphyrin ferrochelatase